MTESIARRIVIASFLTPTGAERTVDRLTGASVGLGNGIGISFGGGSGTCR